ncbi:MAG: phosphotransferase [Candidatus Thermoplasmatota archaeon]|nr:phosphotransferase [Candidatus Thermoplasmatota archaeon]
MDSTAEALEKARVGQVFRSRKNRVFKVIVNGETLVAKIFPSGSDDRATHEYSVLRACVERGVRVPHPVKHEGRALLMEYIEGSTTARIVDDAPLDAESTLLKVVQWLSGFHHANDLRLCRGDCVLHNFMMTAEGVIGIDFEEAHEGDPIEDVGQVMASYLSMRPAFADAKFVVAEHIVSQYMAGSVTDRSEEVPRAISDALRYYGRFREDGALLATWADRIERGGLGSGKE